MLEPPGACYQGIVPHISSLGKAIIQNTKYMGKGKRMEGSVEMWKDPEGSRMCGLPGPSPTAILRAQLLPQHSTAEY